MKRFTPPPSASVCFGVRHRRWSRRGGRVVVTLAVTAGSEITRETARTWARSIARDWGEINNETRVRYPDLPGYAWRFSCSGHGGYVHIAPLAEVPRSVYQQFRDEGSPDWDDLAGRMPRWAAFVFEEDCNSAVFLAGWPGLAAREGRALGALHESIRASQLPETLSALGLSVPPPEVQP